MDEQATIVVGVDGSDCARSALEFALDEATRRGHRSASCGLSLLPSTGRQPEPPMPESPIGRRRHPQTPRSLLADRYARGEIDEAE